MSPPDPTDPLLSPIVEGVGPLAEVLQYIVRCEKGYPVSIMPGEGEFVGLVCHDIIFSIGKIVRKLCR